jgi:hypothetical protein
VFTVFMPCPLNTAQLKALEDYSGTVTAVEQIDSEPSTPAFDLFPVRVTMSTGWIVTLGQYGGVLAEQAPMDSSTRRYLVLNADGLKVAEYDDPDHAIESAHDNAAAGSSAMRDFYTAWDSVDRIELASYVSTDTTEPKKV